MHAPNYDGVENNFMLEIYCKEFLLMIQTDKHLKETGFVVGFQV